MIAVTVMTLCPKIPLIHITTYCYISLHISQSQTGILARIMNHQVQFEAHFRSTHGKGGNVRICTSHPSFGCCLLFGFEIKGPSRLAIATACPSKAHSYNHNLASTDIVIWAGAGCLNKQPDVPGPVLWSSNTGSAMECP